MYIPYQEFLSNKSINLGTFQSTNINLYPLLDYTVSYERNENAPSYVILNGGLNDKVKDLNEFLTFKKDFLENSLLVELQDLKAKSKDYILMQEYSKAIADINAQIEAIDKYLNAVGISTDDTNQDVNSGASVNMVNSSSLTNQSNEATNNQTNLTSNTTISQAKKEALKEYNSLFIKDEEVLNLATDIDLNLASSSLSNYVIFEMLNSPSHKAATA
ncbi:hypothetical protein, partial [Campylobacter avium]|uniref:hypothetical protein n=1 Tax=Campylobacter avium TaxID=522485 RepID=UPI002356D03F